MADTPAPAGAAPAAAPPPAHRSSLRTALVLLGALAVGAAAVYGGVLYWRDAELHPSTRDALLDAHVVAIRSQVSGRVVEVPIVENQLVSKGDVLFRIDPRPFQRALEQANAEVVVVKNEVASDPATIATAKAALETAKAKVQQAEATKAYAQTIYDEFQRAAAAGDSSPREAASVKNQLDQAVTGLAEAQAQLAEAQARLAEIEQRIGDPAAEAARIARAEAAAAIAAINLEWTTIRAPTDGYVTQFDLRVGQYVEAGETVFYFVETVAWWIHANFKETQLARIRPGQPATFTVDMYPDKVFHGVVESISSASAASFTLLPPENATGNWVKVTQRVPVRIRVENPGGDTPFRKGTSVEVTVNTVGLNSADDRRTAQGAAPAPPGRGDAPGAGSP